MKNYELQRYLSTLPPNAEVVHKLIDTLYQPIADVRLIKCDNRKMVKFQIVLVTNPSNE